MIVELEFNLNEDLYNEWAGYRDILIFISLV